MTSLACASHASEKWAPERKAVATGNAFPNCHNRFSKPSFLFFSGQFKAPEICSLLGLGGFPVSIVFIVVSQMSSL